MVGEDKNNRKRKNEKNCLAALFLMLLLRSLTIVHSKIKNAKSNVGY